MLNNLVIAAFILAVGQWSSGPPLKPITDPDAYSIYATLLPSVWKLSGELILLFRKRNVNRAEYHDYLRAGRESRRISTDKRSRLGAASRSATW